MSSKSRWLLCTLYGSYVSQLEVTSGQTLHPNRENRRKNWHVHVWAKGRSQVNSATFSSKSKFAPYTSYNRTGAIHQNSVVRFCTTEFLIYCAAGTERLRNWDGRFREFGHVLQQRTFIYLEVHVGLTLSGIGTEEVLFCQGYTNSWRKKVVVSQASCIPLAVLYGNLEVILLSSFVLSPFTDNGALLDCTSWF